VSSDLYTVAVESVGGGVATLEVRIVHPDIFVLPTSLTFALQLLVDPIHDWLLGDDLKASPLVPEVSVKQILNERWVRGNARRFVASLELLSTAHYPPPGYEDPEYEDFWDGDDRPGGLYRLTATHEKWLAHLTPGMGWETTSYDMGAADR
jgi:hypothetical protein